MINAALINTYFQDQNKFPDYKETVDIANHLCFHTDGHFNYVAGQKIMNPYYTTLITDRRPRESNGVKSYRESIYKDITKATTKKVTNSIQKLFKASDWKIDWSKAVNPPTVAEDESLETYTEQSYPQWGSVENWAQSFLLREMLKDPNGLAVVLPQSFEVEDNEYRKPIVYVIPSKDVYIYAEDRLAVVKSEETHQFTQNGNTYDGDVFWFFDNMQFIRVVQTDLDRNWSSEVISELDSMPVFRLGGEVISVSQGTKLFESFIQGMLPYLDEAAREYSDVQASVVQHLYPTMWFMEGQDCKACNATGKQLKDGRNMICSSCKGEGTIMHSPFKDIVVKKPKFDDQAPITPPAGEINKSTDITTLQAQRVSDHIDSALSALNMEFLTSAPASQSGVAKEFDREELHTYIFGIAHHLVRNILDRTYNYIAWWRYKDMNVDIKAMLPRVAVPEKYDLINDRMMVEELLKSKEAEIDPVIRNEQEIDYTNKRFRTNDPVKNLIIVAKRHDPFPGSDKTKLADLVLAGIIEKVDAILSIYMTSFVTEAIAENNEFLSLDYNAQHAILLAKAAVKAAGVEPETPDEVIIDES